MENTVGNAEGKRNTRGVPFIVTGLLLMAAALVLVCYNLWDARRAERASAEIAGRLEAVIHREDIPGDSASEGVPDAYDGSGGEMPVKEIDGYLYIGILDIPSLGLQLPVMTEWDYARLKISPCLYSGSYITEDMVICAHNYARHFSPIKWIDPGADIYFTAVDGQIYHYQVSNRETVQATAVEDMVAQRREDWDMTLFTCNTGGRTRCAVRCVSVP